jgi:uncharacterized membrane protein YidH (DUF202 family)
MTARAENERREEVASRRTTLALWFGLLGGPAAALASTMINYSAVDRACVSDSSFVLHFLTLFFLVIAVLAGCTAWWARQRVGDWPATAPGAFPRSRFMATVGILTAAVAVFGMILQWVPVFFLGACHGT